MKKGLRKTVKMEEVLLVLLKEYKHHHTNYKILGDNEDLLKSIVVNNIAKKLTNGCRFMKLGTAKNYELIDVSDQDCKTVKVFDEQD